MQKVADSRTKGMIAHVKHHSRENRRIVMSALRNGPQSSMEIKNSVDKYVREKLEKNWNEARERGDKNTDLSEKEEFISKNFHPPAFRTIQLILSVLLAEKLVQVTHAKRREKYSLTQLANDVRYWAEDLGSTMLTTAADNYYPTISTLEQNVDNLVNLFGKTMVFCFMEVSRRNPRLKLKQKVEQYNHELNEEESINALHDIDEVTLDAVRNLFDPVQMYRMFLATIKLQFTDEDIQKTLETRFEKLDDGKAVYIDNEGRRGPPPSIEDLAHNYLLKIELRDKLFYKETFSTIYELKAKELLPLAEALKKRNETLFYRMMDGLSTLMGGKSL